MAAIHMCDGYAVYFRITISVLRDDNSLRVAALMRRTAQRIPVTLPSVLGDKWCVELNVCCVANTLCFNTRTTFNDTYVVVLKMQDILHIRFGSYIRFCLVRDVECRPDDNICKIHIYGNKSTCKHFYCNDKFLLYFYCNVKVTSMM